MFKRCKSFARKLARDEGGATAVEYGILVGLISVGMVAAVTTLGGHVTAAFTAMNNALTGGAFQAP